MVGEPGGFLAWAGGWASTLGAMPSLGRRFVGYDESLAVPNIVVDGSPNEATVLTLTHWPGLVQPAGTDVDTSAEMTFAYLDEPLDHEPAVVVTNNHFDQDGAVGLFCLIDPTAALAHRGLLVDLARAGDFGTYRYRNAARASMTLSAFADPVRSPVVGELTGDAGVDTAVQHHPLLSSPHGASGPVQLHRPLRDVGPVPFPQAAPASRSPPAGRFPYCC